MWKVSIFIHLNKNHSDHRDNIRARQVATKEQNFEDRINKWHEMKNYPHITHTYQQED